MSGDIHIVSGGSGMGDRVAIHGRINCETSVEMRRMLSDALRAKPAKLSVDLSNVSYIDTSGLATLVEAERIARRQGTRLILDGIHDQPRFLFDTAHLSQLFEMAQPEKNHASS